MNRLFVALVFGVSALCAAPAFAQNFSNCEVVEIVSHGDQKNAHVQLNCMPTSMPACATGNPYVAFDKSTTDGKTWFVMFLMAQSTGAKVTRYISDSCPTWQSNVALLT